MPQYTKEELITMAKSEAMSQKVDPVLFCALVEQESGWFPYSWRFEPAYYKKYIAKLYPAGQSTESISRASSWSLTQIMGESARELGYNAASLSSLMDPATNLQYGCMWLAKKLNSAKGDVTKALQSYNGGSNPDYSKQVLSRTGKYNVA